jgi:hypothetical protein
MYWNGQDEVYDEVYIAINLPPLLLGGIFHVLSGFVRQL